MGIIADRVIAVRTNKAVYRDGETVLKVFVESTPAASVMREAMNQAAADEAGFPVPSLCEVTRMDGKWVIRSRYIRGKNLRQLMEAEPARTSEYIDLLVRVQTELHGSREKQLVRMQDDMARRIRNAELASEYKDAFLHKLEEMPESDTFCHGGLSPSNLLISADDGQPYILDWANAVRGDAAADAAMTYVLLQMHDTTGIQSREYLKTYCGRSGLASSDVLGYVPAAAGTIMTKNNENDPILQKFIFGGIP